jgi:hypothetical protein
MENPTVPARASFDLLLDCRVPRDFNLLTQYSAYLIAENIESDRQDSFYAGGARSLSAMTMKSAMPQEAGRCMNRHGIICAKPICGMHARTAT